MCPTLPAITLNDVSEHNKCVYYSLQVSERLIVLQLLLWSVSWETGGLSLFMVGWCLMGHVFFILPLLLYKSKLWQLLAFKAIINSAE